MSKLSVFTASVLLVTTPPTLVCPQNLSPNVFQVNTEENKVNSDYALSYDDMIRLFDEIESGILEKKCSPHELEKIKHLLAFLATEGAIPDNSEESLSLEDDIEELLNGDYYPDAFSFAAPDDYQYVIVPAVLNGHGDVILCKSWLKKKWDQVKKFAKKHKKELIIGAIVVVATVTIVGVAAAAPAAAAVAGGTALAESSSSEKKAEEVSEPATAMAATQEAPILKSTIDDQVSSLKETIMQNQFFQPKNEENGQTLSWEESGRVLGSLFTHDSLNNVQNQISYHPDLAQEIQDIHSRYTFPLQGMTDVSIGHSEIDRKFSTDYAYLFSNHETDVDLNTLSYQVRGERALEFGYYNQAVQDFGKAIEANPANPISYLERGMAHFALGQYDLSLEDYKQFTFEAQKTYPLSIEEFSAGFARGLPKGAYESGKGLLLFLIDLVQHPIYTTWHTIEGFAMLALLARNDEWKIIGEMLVPEAFELVNQWNDLSSDERGELTAFALAKHGTDIFLPGKLSKLASMGLKSGPQLAAIFRKLQIAQDTLVLETATGIGNAAKIAEVVEAGQQTAFFAEELGVSAREMGQLKQAGKLESTLANKYEHLNISMQESLALHNRAQEILKPYAKKPMPEFKVRELIHELGIPTFPKPKGIPEEFLVMVSDRGAGIEYVHPTNTHIRVRVMPGKIHSPNPSQQRPYVVQQKDGKAFDKQGNFVPLEKPESHIPLEEFIYRE